MLEFEKARDYVLERLSTELSPYLTYHCLAHTRDEVVPASDKLAGLEKVGEESRILLLTSAYFHDLGFIHQRQNHEQISIHLAEEALPGFGYSDAQITTIRGIIQATQLPQSPTNLLENIIADADMDELGNESFWKRSNDLRQELENFGTVFTDEGWYSNQLQLLQSHNYFTASERKLRDADKKTHIQELKDLLERVKQLK